MKINQKGFSVVEVLVGIVIIGLIGTVAWFIYDRQKVDSNPTAKTQSTESGVDNNASEDAQLTELQEVSLETFKVSFAKDWSASDKTSKINACDTDGRYSEGLILTKGTKQITISSNGCGKGYTTDGYITYAIENSMIKISSKNLTLCGSNDDDLCSSGNGKLNIGSSVVSQKGNGYTIRFSNSANEDVSEPALRDIYTVIEAIEVL